MRKPYLGADVYYVSDEEDRPKVLRAAIVTGTQDTIILDEEAEELDSDYHVHLTVIPPSPYDIHAEVNVKMDPGMAHGTWHWPPVVHTA